MFGAFVLTDIAWARYTIHVAAKHAFRSAVDSMFIVLTGAISVVAYQDSVWFVIPACMGAALATYVVVNRSKGT